jgi:hypothetical protein
MASKHKAVEVYKEQGNELSGFYSTSAIPLTPYKMLFQNLSVATLLAALPSALALPSNHILPKVTIKALPADCSSYPGYNADSKTAGPWIVQLNKSENPALESFGDSVIYSTSTGPSGISAMSSGHVCLPLNPQIG